MASEASGPVNGIYGVSSHASSQPTPLTNGGSSEQPTAASPAKDEVGWYFVEQYYTTMSRNPEKVHLFYNKRSQFVYGVETEKVPVSVGQSAINERIAELGIEDCKVRVTNVDSQESGKSIVLQVIGEMSVKGQLHRKFAQTFVLAEQPNGYFVLNDIFRYIADEPEDEEEPEVELDTQPQQVVEEQTEAKQLTSSGALVDDIKAAEIVDQKLEQAASDEHLAETVPALEPSTTEVVVEEAVNDTPISEAVAEVSAEADDIKPEAPKDPEPTPAATPAVPISQPSKESAAPAKSAAPKSWASMVAAGSKPPIPVIPNVPIQSTPAQVQPKPAPTAAAPAVTTAVESASTAAQAPASDTEVPASSGGWQTAGQDHGKKQNRNQAGGNVNAYIKNVTPNIEASALRQTLSQYGKISYFDISRPKNCAFIEFETPAGFNAAVAANPHKVNGEDIVVEERRPRASTFGNNFRGNARGGRGGMDNRTPSQGGRGGQGSRGGYASRGRGGPASRGRGGVAQES